MIDPLESSPHQAPEPVQPSPCESCKKTRRDILLGVGMGLNLIAAGLIGIPLVGFALSSFFKSMPLQWINLGPTNKFPEGTTRLTSFRNPQHRSWDGVTADIPCWVRHIQANQFQVFAINCTHLGCPVRWFEESQLFLCPCHGGAFYADGKHAAGPPPRGLYQYETEVRGTDLWILGGLLPTLADPEKPSQNVG